MTGRGICCQVRGVTGRGVCCQVRGGGGQVEEFAVR